MIRSLILSSLLLLFAFTSLMAQGTDAATYSFALDARGRNVTGICMTETNAEGLRVGTIVNEMGVKAFDFTFDGRRVRVLNLFKPLNKWYIRKLLRADLKFIMSHRDSKETMVKQRHMTVSPEGEIKMENRKYRLSYLFTPMKDSETSKGD